MAETSPVQRIPTRRARHPIQSSCGNKGINADEQDKQRQRHHEVGNLLQALPFLEEPRPGEPQDHPDGEQESRCVQRGIRVNKTEQMFHAQSPFAV